MNDATKNILVELLNRAVGGLSGVKIEEKDPDTLVVRFPMAGNVVIELRARLHHVGVVGFSVPITGDPFP